MEGIAASWCAKRAGEKIHATYNPAYTNNASNLGLYSCFIWFRQRKKWTTTNPRVLLLQIKDEHVMTGERPIHF